MIREEMDMTKDINHIKASDLIYQKYNIEIEDLENCIIKYSKTDDEFDDLLLVFTRFA
jgi:hypothetical protein